MGNLEIERARPGVAVLRFNRPEKLNALSWALIDELHEMFETIHRDSTIRVVVLTGAGRGFCAGLDLAEAAAGRGPELTREVEGRGRSGLLAQNLVASLIPHMRRMQQPVIAAVNGVAYGGGFALTLGSDLRLAGRSARFCSQFINLGLSGCDIGTSWLLPRLIGAAHAHELLLTGRAIDADEALELGIVSRVVDDDALLDTALTLADELCEKSPSGLFMTKEVLWANLEVASLEAGIHLENRNQILAGSEGGLEAASADFVAKRRAP